MSTPARFGLRDLQTMECPYPAYDRLRNEAPVYLDETTGVYVITRFADVRAILLDARRFIVGGARPHPKADLIARVYEREGAVVPAPSLSGMDNPEHRELRRIYNAAFSARNVAELEGYLTELAHSMVDGVGERTELVGEFAARFTTHAVGHIMGIESEEDLHRIRVWAAAWIDRLGMMTSDDDVIRATELEAEAQRYFQPIIDRLRASGESVGLLGHVVRAEIPEWGRRLTDGEAQTAILVSMFVAGSETAASVLGEGVRVLIEQPELAMRLRFEPDLLPAFVEEMLRYEAPAQGIYRRTTESVELHGVTIPAGAQVALRPGAGNRDERQFDCPAEIRLDRANGARHLTFGQGTHACLGAALARLELTVAFRALLERVQHWWFVEGANDFGHKSNLVVRGLNELHIGLQLRGRA